MKCPTCGHDPDDIQQKRAAVSRWSVMNKKERSEEMSRIRRKGIKKPKRVARTVRLVPATARGPESPDPPSGSQASGGRLRRGRAAQSTT